MVSSLGTTTTWQKQLNLRELMESESPAGSVLNSSLYTKRIFSTFRLQYAKVIKC